MIKQKAIPIINQPTATVISNWPLKYSIDRSVFQSTSIDHSGSIDRGGFGFDRPILVSEVAYKTLVHPILGY